MLGGSGGFRTAPTGDSDPGESWNMVTATLNVAMG